MKEISLPYLLKWEGYRRRFLLLILNNFMHVESEFSAPKGNSIFARLQLKSFKMGDKREVLQLK